MAGPAPGPDGGQVFVDGFSGGSLPPKSAIREIRINSNPFSPEYDHPGFARIDVFTKPGSDTFRGQVFGQFNDAILNSRNPLLTQTSRPPYGTQLYGFNIGGPIKKNKTFFFADFEKVRSVEIVALYNNEEVWKTFGYQGASFRFGGYLHHGFNDLNWLPDPPEEASPKPS